MNPQCLLSFSAGGLMFGKCLGKSLAGRYYWVSRSNQSGLVGHSKQKQYIIGDDNLLGNSSTLLEIRST